jgi:hypothetical protein
MNLVLMNLADKEFSDALDKLLGDEGKTVV